MLSHGAGLLAATAFLAALLAGCNSNGTVDDPEETGSSPAPDASTYTITFTQPPLGPYEVGETFTFNMSIDGNLERTTDHIGGHFGNTSTQQPSVETYPIACQHQAGNLPGDYRLTCTAPQQTGAYFLRGHARITFGDGTAVNWWSPEAGFTVVPLQN